MSNINKNAVLNPFTDLTTNILNYVPRATATEFGIVAIGSGISVDALGRIYLDTQEYSDRLTAIEVEAASSLATQKSEIAAAITQVNLAQSQAVSNLTLEVSNLKTSLTAHADQLSQNVTNITQQLTQDKATFTQEIQDALNYLKAEASVASSLRTPRTFTWTGDVTGGLSFNGTSDVSTALTLANSGVTAGTYKSVTVDAKGRVTSGNTVSTSLVTSTSATGNTNVATTNTNTFLNITEKVGSAASTVSSSSQVTGAGTITVTSDTAGKLTITGSQTITGNAATATKFQTARTINGVAFDGSANITITDSTKLPLGGTAVAATKLATPRNINGVAFDGSADITLPLPTKASLGLDNVDNTSDANKPISTATQAVLNSKANTVDVTNQINTLTSALAQKLDSTATAAAATKLATARTINGISFDGTANITIADNTKLPNSGGTVSGALNFANSTWNTVGDDTQFGDVDLGGILGIRSNNETSHVGLGFYMVGADKTAPTAVLKVLASGEADLNVPLNCYLLKGNATSATKLATPRTIAITGAATGSATFDGSSNLNISTTVSFAGISAKPTTLAGYGIVDALNKPNNLSDLQDKATARTNLDVYSKTESNFLALPLGTPIWHNGTRLTIDDGYAAYDGQLLNRADFPSLWAKVQSKFIVISDAEWLSNPKKRAAYSSGDGSTTFRMPDLNGFLADSIKGLFLRGDGNGTIAGETVGQSTILTDSIRNITGQFLGGGDGTSRVSTWYASTNTGAFTLNAVTGGASKTNGAAAGSETASSIINIDASKVVPTANENRPVSAVGIWICRVSVGTAEQVLPNAAPSLSGGNTWAGSQSVQGNLTVSGQVSGNIKPLLNATGDAPIYACRAWVNFNAVPLSGTYTQSGTTVTVTMTAHGMSVGQNVNLTFTSGTAVSGSFTVATVSDANIFTYTATTSLTTSGNVTRNTFIRASGNVLGVMDNGVADYTVNFIKAMPNINYSAIGNGNLNNGESWAVAAVPSSVTTTSFRILTKNVTVNGADLLAVNFAVFG